MGLGGATKKLQRVADMGEELYGKMNELREQINEVREAVQDTHEGVTALENKVDQQGALLEALAEREGIDVDAVLTEVAIEEAEPAITDAEGGADEGETTDSTTDDNAVADAEADGAGTESTADAGAAEDE